MDPRGRDDMVEAISELVQRIGLASQRIGHAFADVQQLHPTDFRAVAAIYRAQLGGQQLSAQALARVLDLSPAAITYVIDRLVAAGHVRRERDPADGRRVVLAYDTAGMAMARSFFDPLKLAHSSALASFRAEELATTERVLASVVGALDSFEHRLRDRAGGDGEGPDERPG